LLDSKYPKRFWSFIKSKTKSKTIPPVVKFGDDEASLASEKAQRGEMDQQQLLLSLNYFNEHQHNINI